ncbi:MAG: DinB family protein [Dehalococcoidales bacterium]|nr:DinB family protein [Dehalococcoidales bacterium]
MEVKDLIRMQIEGLDHGLKRVLDGLKQEEIVWRPASGCNSIGLILFHIFKSEDSFIQTHLKGKKELWETGKWYTQLNLDPGEAGAHYTVEQVDNFPVPALEEILRYGAAVRAATLEYVKNVTPAELEKVLKMPWGDMPIAMLLSFTASHASQHIGEISYLRGLQRGLDK